MLASMAIITITIALARLGFGLARPAPPAFHRRLKSARRPISPSRGVLGAQHPQEDELRAARELVLSPRRRGRPPVAASRGRWGAPPRRGPFGAGFCRRLPSPQDMRPLELRTSGPGRGFPEEERNGRLLGRRSTPFTPVDREARAFDRCARVPIQVAAVSDPRWSLKTTLTRSRSARTTGGRRVERWAVDHGSRWRGLV